MLDRLIKLEDNFSYLENFKKSVSIDNILENKFDEWALRYGLLESVQIVIDISCHLVSKYNLGNPKNYSDCIRLLIQNKYLDKKIGGKLIGMIGLRNILIHEYIKIDLKKLFSLLDSIDDFKVFAIAVKDII